ncbi:MAG: alpha/beta fold hydrolase [Novosphingobium sp.]
MFGTLKDEAFQRGGAAWREARLKADETRSELTRRTALAREPRPQGVSGPSMRRLLGELGSLADRRGRVHPVAVAAAPKPVMLLPGFGSHPARMAPLRRALEAAGHGVIDWGLGFNIGPTPENFAFLVARVVQLARTEGAPVTLVGWSLGGLFARELAKARPDAVASVITMGTPFSGNRRANNAWRAYQFVTGHSVDAPPIPCDFAIKPPVRTVALWSPRDGVVSPRSSCGWPGERDQAVALRCSHLGFARDQRAIAEVLRQIDLPDIDDGLQRPD